MSYGHIAVEYRRRTRDLHKADRMSMEAILHQYGFPKSAAGKLVKEGMGPHELIQRAKLPATGPGGLTWTHRIKQTRNRGVQSLSKTKKEQRLARIEKAVLKIINSTPMNQSFLDDPVYKRLMKERDNLLGI